MAGGVCGRGHVWRGGVWQGGSMHGGGVHGEGHAWQGACMAGGHAWQVGMSGRRVGHCSGWYVTYWNAFLLNKPSVN